MYELVSLIESTGGLVVASGDGRERFSASGNIITSYALGALGSINNPNAWYCVTDVGGATIFTIQRLATPEQWRIIASENVSENAGGSPTVPCGLKDAAICIDGSRPSFTTSCAQHVYIFAGRTQTTDIGLIMRRADSAGTVTTSGMLVFNSGYITPRNTQERFTLDLRPQPRANIDRNRMRRTYGPTRSVPRPGIVA
jgi:hypothetical protein